MALSLYIQGQEGFDEKYRKIVERADNDAVFRMRLKAEPVAVLREAGLTIPEGIEIRVRESDPACQYLFLPPRPARDLSKEQPEGPEGVRESPSSNLRTPRASAASVIPQIPQVMEAKGWPQAASLLRHWLSQSQHQAPTYATPDTTTITMEWVLGYPRAKKDYDRIFSERKYINSAAQQVLTNQLIRKGLHRTGGSFGDFWRPVTMLHDDQINFLPHEDTFTLDGLSAALHNFTFYVTVKGRVNRPGYYPPYLVAPTEVLITDVGVYVVDSFDFNDSGFISQPLGCWNPKTNAVDYLFCGSDGAFVNNARFREWRAANGMGGDFRVYSDLKVTHLQTPESFVAYM